LIGRAKKCEQCAQCLLCTTVIDRCSSLLSTLITQSTTTTDRSVVRAPSCPEIPEISQLSWNCPEIRNCPEILLIWPECPEIDLCYAVVTALPLFCTLYLFNWTLSVLLAYLLTTISPYVHCSFMCNIALVTFCGLQYWSASTNSIYEHIKTSLFCVLSLVKPTKMSWNCPEIFQKLGPEISLLAAGSPVLSTCPATDVCPLHLGLQLLAQICGATVPAYSVRQPHCSHCAHYLVWSLWFARVPPSLNIGLLNVRRHSTYL